MLQLPAKASVFLLAGFDLLLFVQQFIILYGCSLLFPNQGVAISADGLFIMVELS